MDASVDKLQVVAVGEYLRHGEAKRRRSRQMIGPVTPYDVLLDSGIDGYLFIRVAVALRCAAMANDAVQLCVWQMSGRCASRRW